METMWYLRLIGPAVIVLAATIAWHQHRKLAAQRGTLDFLLRNEVDNVVWRRTRRKAYELLKASGPKSDDEKLMVRAFLSRYEFIAVAIKHRVMDETIYWEWNGRTYVGTWLTAEEYIIKRRRARGKTTVYSEFEKLAKKWEQKLKCTKRNETQARSPSPESESRCEP